MQVCHRPKTTFQKSGENVANVAYCATLVVESVLKVNDDLTIERTDIVYVRTFNL